MRLAFNAFIGSTHKLLTMSPEVPERQSAQTLSGRVPRHGKIEVKSHCQASSGQKNRKCYYSSKPHIEYFFPFFIIPYYIFHFVSFCFRFKTLDTLFYDKKRTTTKKRKKNDWNGKLRYCIGNKAFQSFEKKKRFSAIFHSFLKNIFAYD